MAKAEKRGPLRAILFFALALVAGGISVAVIWLVIQNYESRIENAQYQEEMKLAIVAQRTLYPGLTITEEDVVAVPIPVTYYPPNVYASPQQVVGQVPKERILPNEYIRSERLSNRSDGVGLNALVSRGMRAVSIDISKGASLSGFLNPGNYVDVLVTIQSEGHPPETRTILQAVYVLAVAGRTLTPSGEVAPAPTGKKSKKAVATGVRRTREAAPSVTLQVTPEQAEQLAHASQRGAITLLLRNDLDLQVAESDGVTTDILVGKKEPEVVAKKPVVRKEQGPTLMIYKGTSGRQFEYKK
ncbi:MAG: Flp pilus assembly protein CpaB [Deltaproteobacteria bacterium]|nr:Flp pilus assembly protein CpaB [Deltaproteobacteria bacterium]